VFACSDVATIVAETHNNYILHDRLLKCRVVEPSSLTWKILKPFKIKPKQIVKQPRTQREIGKRVKGLLRRESKRRKRLKDLGIDYDFPGYVSCIKSNEHLIKTSKHTIFNEEDD
jgi:nucleolar protein 15